MMIVSKNAFYENFKISLGGELSRTGELFSRFLIEKCVFISLEGPPLIEERTSGGVCDKRATKEGRKNEKVHQKTRFDMSLKMNLAGTWARMGERCLFIQTIILFRTPLGVNTSYGE